MKQNDALSGAGGTDGAKCGHDAASVSRRAFVEMAVGSMIALPAAAGGFVWRGMASVQGTLAFNFTMAQQFMAGPVPMVLEFSLLSSLSLGLSVAVATPEVFTPPKYTLDYTNTGVSMTIGIKPAISLGVGVGVLFAHDGEIYSVETSQLIGKFVDDVSIYEMVTLDRTPATGSGSDTGDEFKSTSGHHVVMLRGNQKVYYSLPETTAASSASGWPRLMAVKPLEPKGILPFGSFSDRLGGRPLRIGEAAIPSAA